MDAIIDWKLAQLLLGGITVDKLKNKLWGILSYLNNSVPTPNDQTFIPFVIFPPYFYSDLSFLTFSYIFLNCSYLYNAIFNDVMNFELILFLEVD